MTCENPGELIVPQDIIKIINYKIAELRIIMKNEMKELSMLEMENVCGGSPLSYCLLWFAGKMFTSPAVLNENGMNPVHLYN